VKVRGVNKGVAVTKALNKVRIGRGKSEEYPSDLWMIITLW
jgi:hypothetical protein